MLFQIQTVWFLNESVFLNKTMTHSYSKDIPSHYLLMYRCNIRIMIVLMKMMVVVLIILHFI